jgi:hypothetical protein
LVVVDPAAKAKERERLGGEIEAKAAAERAEYEVKAGEWPWGTAVERLSVGLLSQNWETRHGAALGLREVLKLQGSGGGKLEGLSLKVNEERHRSWSEDLATKLLCVFALDRFGDYVSDQVRFLHSSPSRLYSDRLPAFRSSPPSAKPPLKPSPFSSLTCPLPPPSKFSAFSSTWSTRSAPSVPTPMLDG